MIWLFTLPVVEEGIYIGSISSEDIENFDDESSWLQYTLAVFSHEQIQSARSIGSFAKNHTNLIPFWMKRTAIGYYEIDDIMSFSPNHF
jgi:hypothetical protein